MNQIPRREFLKQLGATAVMTWSAQSRGQPLSLKTSVSGDMNILVIVLDALSATNMSLYGYPRETTPHLNELAKQSIVYHSHYAGGSFTPPGTASLLTGTFAFNHRSTHFGGMIATDRVQEHLFRSFPDYHRIAYTHNPWVELQLMPYRPDITEHIFPSEFALQDLSNDLWMSRHDPAAYHAIEDFAMKGPVSGSLYLQAAKRVVKAAGEAKLNARYGEMYPRGVPELYGLAYRLRDACDGMLERIQKCPRPFLSYFHVLPPHAPYSPRKEFVGCFPEDWSPEPKPRHPFQAHFSEEELKVLRMEYDENVAYADAEVGRMIEKLREQDLLDSTCIVVTSDHGEMFERGIYEHETPHLFDPVIRVPLLIRPPGGVPPQSVHSFTSAVDVLPTLLKLSGRPPLVNSDGIALPPFSGIPSSRDRDIYALDARRSPKKGPMTLGTVACLRDPYKLIYYHGYKAYSPKVELFNLREDPEELNDLSESRKDIAKTMLRDCYARLEASKYRAGGETLFQNGSL